MSQPTDETPVGVEVPSRDERTPEPATFTLVVVSPSTGVSSPLTFPRLDRNTTVKQLKAKLRDALPSKPADDRQRLIHRGRLLSRETETMRDVFGQEALSNPETQTLHLVLRPSSVDSPATSTVAVEPSRTIPVLLQLQPRPQSTPANPIQGMIAQQPLPGFQHVQHNQGLHQADNIQNAMFLRLQHLQRETQRLHQEMQNIEQRSRAYTAAAIANPGLYNDQPGTGQPPLAIPHNIVPGQVPMIRSPPVIPPALQNLIAQQQRERPAEGRQGTQDTGGIAAPSGQPHQTSSGRASPIVHRPDHTNTYTREGVGPNGERWQVTVNETNTTFPVGQAHHYHHHHHHPNQHLNNLNAQTTLDNLHAILRNADRTLANSIANLEPPAANPPTAAGGAAAGPVRVPTPAGADTPAGIATPATTNSSPSSSVLLNPTANPNLSASNPNAPALSAPTFGRVDPVVYLLSSPSGPRALLLNNSDTFYSPRQTARRSRRYDENHPAPTQGQQTQPGFGLPEFRNRDAQRAARRERRIRGEQNPVQPLNVGPHANPGAGAIAAQVGPIIWLIVRLIGFVWFFTAGNSSWTRWFMVSGLALVVFIINTGVLNGIFEQLWGPIRRHVEVLIPLAGPEAALVPAVNAAIPPQPAAAPPPEAGQEPQRRRRGELDPAQVAAHLLEQHRLRHQGWLMTQIRRAEHATLLFLASLVPGVGERHIAAREAEANAAEAERQRLIAAEDAAASQESGNSEQTAAQGEEGAVSDNTEIHPQNAEGAEAPPLAPAQPLTEV